MQTFVSQATFDGDYEVARWDEVKGQYIPLRDERYPTQIEAEERAHQLNEEIEQQNA